MSAPDVPDRRASLSQVLKALRRQRGLRPGQVAQAMGMRPRSYEYFESGRGRLNLDRIHRFAEVLDVDPFAIVAALEIGSPRFALRCADNKLMTILIMALQDFDTQAGDDIARLDARSLIGEFTRALDELARRAREHDAFVETWMAEKGSLAKGGEGG
jgi:transcriptional regulator with XRE-family HTH domain